jgi:predicted acylesterase/phospholipase RssA
MGKRVSTAKSLKVTPREKAIQEFKKNLKERILPPNKRFSRLIRSVTQKDTKVVLGLGGGGIRMFAHTALLKFLEQLKLEPYLSEIWGVSGGAMIGLLYSMGLKSQDIQEEAYKIASGRKNLKIVPSYFSVAKNLAMETLSEILFSNNNKENIRGFHNCQQELQEFIEKLVKGAKEKYPFFALAYNLEKNQTDVLTPTEFSLEAYPQWIYRTDPLDAVIASSSIPILFVPKVIEDAQGRRIYADGATSEEVPTVSIYKKWLRDRELGLESRSRLLVISVNLNPEFSSLGFLENWLLRKIPAFQYIQMSIRYADLMRKAKIEEQKRQLMNDPNVELWDLDFQLKGGGLMNVGLIPKIITVAEESLLQQLTQINDSLLA